MMIDFAIEAEREHNMSRMDAIHQACLLRFRPILMTTFAMIFGMLPLSLGITEGAETRASMGTVLIGGLISSLILTLALVPVMYTWIMGRVDANEHRKAAKRALSEEYMSDVDGVPRLELPAH